MITFDKLKLRITPDLIIGYDNSQFFNRTFTTEGFIKYLYKNRDINLDISVQPKLNLATIEFTSKVLKERYPALISSETIEECLEKINRLEICELVSRRILLDATVSKCDVTKDIETNTLQLLKDIAVAYPGKANWSVQSYLGKRGFVLNKGVSSRESRRRLSCYDKEYEMMKKNKSFLDSLDNRDEVIEYFKGKLRFELNLYKPKAIKEVLKIPDASLQSVLTSTANPIRDVWWQGVKQPQHGKKIRGITDFHRCSTLELYGHNFDLIRLKLSHIYESPNGINREIAKIKAVSQAMKPVDFSWVDEILIQAA